MGIDPSRLPPHIQRKLLEQGKGDMIAAPKKPRAQPEAALQQQIVRRLDVELAGKAVRWSALMNGQYMRTEAARRKAWEQGRRPGTLDLVFIPLVGHRFATRTFWFEVKVKGNYPSKEQKEVLEGLGWFGAWGTSEEEVMAFLESRGLLAE